MFSPRFNLLAADGCWLSETPEVRGSKSWDSASIRYLNWVQLFDNRTHREFRVWNTHLDHQSQPAREGQTRTLLAVAGKLPEAVPQLLTADFNADIRNPIHPMLHAGGWRDTYAAVHGDVDPGFTFHGFHGPDYIRHRGSNTNGKIDFIFGRGPWKVHGAEVIRDGRDGRFPSDHYFISADVELG